MVIQRLFYENRDIIEREIKSRASDLINSGRFCFNDVDDISQELRIEVFKSFARYDPKKSKINTFIQNVVKKKGIDLLRYKEAKCRGHNKTIFIEDLLLSTELRNVNSISELLIYTDETNERHFDIELMLSDLPNEYRRIYQLLMEDYNVLEISKILKRNRRTIKKQILEIQKFLRNS